MNSRLGNCRRDWPRPRGGSPPFETDWIGRECGVIGACQSLSFQGVIKIDLGWIIYQIGRLENGNDPGSRVRDGQ